MWLACGMGGFGCGIDFDVQAQAKEEHEVRCCSDYPIEGWRRLTTCQNWQQSKLVALDGTPDQCIHDATLAEAKLICRANGGYVCTQEQVKSGCAKGELWCHVNQMKYATQSSHLFLFCFIRIWMWS